MCLEDDVPPDKPFNPTMPSCYDTNDISQCNPIENATSLSNASTSSYLITLDSDTVQLYIDTCVTGGLTGFASDFIPDICKKTTATKTKTATGEATIVGQGKTTYTFLDDKGDLYTINTLMSYAPQSKHRLIYPQWLGTKEATACTPKELRAKCEIDDEYATLFFENRTKTVTIKHDSSMLVPVLNVNLGIRKYQQFSASFCTLI